MTAEDRERELAEALRILMGYAQIQTNHSRAAAELARFVRAEIVAFFGSPDAYRFQATPAASPAGDPYFREEFAQWMSTSYIYTSETFREGLMAGWRAALDLMHSKARGSDGGSERRHPGYVIGDHWLEAAYDRVCAGEHITQIMADYGWMRTPEPASDVTCPECGLRPVGGRQHHVKGCSRLRPGGAVS